MLHTHFIQNVPIHIHTNGTILNDYLVEKVTKLVDAILELADDTIKIDVRLSEYAGQLKSPRSVSVLVALSGVELNAADSGRQWKMLLKHVEKRITRQIEKRKDLIKRKLAIGATITTMQTGLRA